MNNFRLVVDEIRGLCYFNSVVGGGNSGLMNSSAASIIKRLVKTDDDVEKRQLYEKNNEFINKCYNLGILDGNLNVRGIVRDVPSSNHLKLVQIESLLKCNLKCGYCYCEAGKNRSEFISIENIYSIIGDADRLGVLDLDFTGGEFFLRRDWRDIIVEARRVCLKTSIHTNGMALSERNIQFLNDNCVGKLQVSVDGMDSQTHNAVRGHPRSFERALAGIRLALSAGITVGVNLMVHRSNVSQLPKAYRYFRDLGVSVIVDWIAPFGSEQERGHGLPINEYIEAVLAVPELRQLADASLPCGRDLGMSPDQLEPHCGVGQSYLFVTATGELAICPTLTSREDPLMFGGPTLNECSLYEAWTNHPYFDRHRYVNCANVETCVAGTECRGGCRATAYATSGGNVRSPDIIECNLRKNTTSSFVDFFSRYAVGEFGVAR